MTGTRDRFWWWLAGGMVAFQLLASAIFVMHAPPGQIWLGANVQNAADTAVYQSLIRQVADGAYTQAQLYDAEPDMRRFFPFWTLLGLISRIGIPPLVMYELGRVAGAICLAYALWLTARRVFEREADAKLACVLAIGGMSLGWTYRPELLHAFGLVEPLKLYILDLHTEYSIIPTLLGSGHIALSMALLMSGLRLMWERMPQEDARRSWPCLACFAGLLAFHPYYVLIYVVYTLIVGMYVYRLDRRPRLTFVALHVLPLLPAVAIYAPLALDRAFRTQHSVVNDLPLPPWPVIVLILLPFLVALAWRCMKRVGLRESEQWLVAWAIAATLTLFIPLPWKAKMLEGMGVCLTFLGMPAWLRLRDYLTHDRLKIPNILIAGTLVCTVFGSAICLQGANISLASNPKFHSLFYASQDQVAAWEYLRTHASTDAVITSDDPMTMLWTPSYTDRHMWLAHMHETTDYGIKAEAWRRFWETDDMQRAGSLLVAARVTDVMTTFPSSTHRMETLPGWTMSFSQGDMHVFSRVAKTP